MEALDAVCRRVRGALLPSGVSAGQTPAHLRALVDDWQALYEVADREAGGR